MTSNSNKESFNVDDIYIAETNEQIQISPSDCDSDTLIGSGSWADIVDTEISGHIENKLLTSNSYDSTGKNHKQAAVNVTYNIADIVSKNPETIDDMTLLEWQVYLSSNLKKYIKQCAESTDRHNKLDYNLHISKFEWLARASKFLSDKLGLIITNHKMNNFDVQKGVIPRSSYKFCEYNYDCQFNYKEKYNGCYAQHFVHNLVFADISAMIYYLKANYEAGKEYNYDELVKCITTISYVIKHMYEEFSNLQFHYGNIDNVHIERSKVKKEKKKQNSSKSISDKINCSNSKNNVRNSLKGKLKCKFKEV